MSKAKKVFSGDVLKNVVTGGMYTTMYKPLREIGKGGKMLVNNLMGKTPLPKMPGVAKVDEPVAAPVIDDEELKRARQKELLRRTNAGRAATVMSGSSGLG